MKIKLTQEGLKLKEKYETTKKDHKEKKQYSDCKPCEDYIYCFKTNAYIQYLNSTRDYENKNEIEAFTNNTNENAKKFPHVSLISYRKFQLNDWGDKLKKLHNEVLSKTYEMSK